MTDRIERERAFQDAAVKHKTKQSVGKYYSIFRSSKEEYYRRISAGGLDGRRILELGCGPGAYAIPLAEGGARLDSVDISPRSIETAREKSVAQGVADRVALHEMNAEALTFDDGCFDVVCGMGILHHLDLSPTMAGIRRVLRPGGRAVFLEPMGHYRRSTCSDALRRSSAPRTSTPSPAGIYGRWPRGSTILTSASSTWRPSPRCRSGGPLSSSRCGDSCTAWTTTS